MTTLVPPPAGRGKVPVWRTAIDSYRFVFANLDRFFALGWLPLVIAFAASMTLAVLVDVGGGTNAPVADWVSYLALSAASWAMYIVFAVRWHRFFLLNERESVFTHVLGMRNWRFLGYTVLLSFAPVVPMLVVGLIGFGVFVSVVESQGAGAVELALILLFGLSGFAAFILMFVMFRFYLVLPGTAVDRPLTLGEAWRNMRGNSWRFIGAFFLVAIPLIIVALILATFGGISEFSSMTSGAPEPTIGVLVVTNAVTAIIGFFTMAVGVTVLSIFYRHIVGMDAPEGGEIGAAAGP